MVSNKVWSGGIRGFIFNGGLDFLFSGIISFCIIKYIVIPIHSEYGTKLTISLSEKSNYFESTDEGFVFQVNFIFDVIPLFLVFRFQITFKLIIPHSSYMYIYFF